MNKANQNPDLMSKELENIKHMQIVRGKAVISDDIYTPEQLEYIQFYILGLLSYMKRNLTGRYPHSFDFCKRIIRNIDMCRKGNYVGIDELTLLIRQDWESAMDSHGGKNPDALLEIYICFRNDNGENLDTVSKTVNQTIGMFISTLDRLI